MGVGPLAIGGVELPDPDMNYARGAVALALLGVAAFSPLGAQGRPAGAPLGVTAPQPCWRYLGSRRALTGPEQQQVLRELLLVRPACPVMGYSWGARTRPSFFAYDRERLDALHGSVWPGMASQWQRWAGVYLTDLLDPDPWGRPVAGDSLSRHDLGWGILPPTPRLTAFVRRHVGWADALGRLDWPVAARRGPRVAW